MDDLRRLLNLANAVVKAGGDSRPIMHRIEAGDDGERDDLKLTEALNYAAVLIRLGHSVLVEPVDGGYKILANVRKPKPSFWCRYVVGECRWPQACFECNLGACPPDCMKRRNTDDDVEVKFSAQNKKMQAAWNERKVPK